MKENKQWIQNEETVGYNVSETKYINKTKEDNNVSRYIPESSIELPKSIDWTRYVSQVVEQGECGACWSFAATGVIESAVAIKNKTDVVNLSEQQLIDCVPSSYGNDKCDGGIVRKTLQFIKEKKGVCLDDDYKYVSGVDCKKKTCMAGECKKCNLQPIDMDYNCSKGEYNLIYKLQKGPVTAIINSSPRGLQNYKQGIFDIKDKTQRDKFIVAEHGVLVVGYGEENGVKFWKIKNTWGDKWGENGYFRIQRGDRGDIGLLGVARQNCSVTINDPKMT